MSHTIVMAVAAFRKASLLRNVDGLCVLPAAVNETPAGLQISAEMKRLVSTVVSPDSKLRVGFHGAPTLSALMPPSLARRSNASRRRDWSSACSALAHPVSDLPLVCTTDL